MSLASHLKYSEKLKRCFGNNLEIQKKRPRETEILRHTDIMHLRHSHGNDKFGHIQYLTSS